MKRSNRVAWLGAIALVIIILFSLIAAPSTKIYSGSTYNRGADGYGAWYAFMQQQKVTIQRWQKPLSDLNTQNKPATLLQISTYQREPSLFPGEREWIEKGNILVILGVKSRVSEANFNTTPSSPIGEVEIATRRRNQKVKSAKISLGDRFGAIVWEEKYDQGKVIFSTTPHLAANAYQDRFNNFQYLASLVTQKNKNIFVDEYIHGYKDADTRETEGEGDLVSYLAKTPVTPLLVQVGVLLLVVVWAQNRRFGKPVALDTPVIDNSEAYIQALAGVLQKAESSDFVMEMVGKAEQLQLQKALGLGQTPLEQQTLVNVWAEKTGAGTAELNAVLKLQAQKSRKSERDLLSWLGKWRTVRRLL